MLDTLCASVIGFLAQLTSRNVVHDDLHRRRAFVIDPHALDIYPRNGAVESVDLGFPRFGAGTLLQDLPRPGRDRVSICSARERHDRHSGKVRQRSSPDEP